MTVVGDDGQTALREAEEHDRAGREAEAIACYRRALERGLPEPLVAAAFLGLGSTYRNLGMLDESRRTLEEALERFPDRPELLPFYALTLHDLGRASEALAVALRAALARTEGVDRYARAIAAYADELGGGAAGDRLDHVQLAIPDGGEDEARRFYRDGLGFEEVPKPEALAKRGGAWFRRGGIALHLGVDPAFTPAKKAHPALSCADYEERVARLRALGYRVLPDDLPFEGKAHCYVDDPFGNRIELISAC